MMIANKRHIRKTKEHEREEGKERRKRKRRKGMIRKVDGRKKSGRQTKMTYRKAKVTWLRKKSIRRGGERD